MELITEAGLWETDPYAYDSSVRVREFVYNGRRLVAKSFHADAPEGWPLTVRDGVTGRYVACVSNWRLLSKQLAERGI